jgi:hypothetical protein
MSFDGTLPPLGTIFSLLPEKARGEKLSAIKG